MKLIATEEQIAEDDFVAIIAEVNERESIIRTVAHVDAPSYADLFAAAPELLEVLKELVESPNAKQNALWDKARAAIAKADPPAYDYDDGNIPNGGRSRIWTLVNRS